MSDYVPQVGDLHIISSQRDGVVSMLLIKQDFNKYRTTLKDPPWLCLYANGRSYLNHLCCSGKPNEWLRRVYRRGTLIHEGREPKPDPVSASYPA